MVLTCPGCGPGSAQPGRLSRPTFLLVGAAQGSPDDRRVEDQDVTEVVVAEDSRQGGEAVGLGPAVEPPPLAVPAPSARAAVRQGMPVGGRRYRTASMKRRLSSAMPPCRPGWPGSRSLMRSQSASEICKAATHDRPSVAGHRRPPFTRTTYLLSTRPSPDSSDAPSDPAMRPAGFEPATKGFEGPRVSAGLGLSHPPHPPMHSTPGRLPRGVWRPGALRRGLSLGLTPLVSEPSWPPEPGQAWLRIAVPGRPDSRRDRPGLGSPQFTRIASGGYPPAPPFSMSPLLCR